MSVNPFDLHEFLSLSDRLVVIALLIGTSVAYRGTLNFYVSKNNDMSHHMIFYL